MASFKERNGKVQITITHGKKFDGTPQRYYREVENTTKKQLKIEEAIFLADIMAGKVVTADTTTLDALYKNYLLHNGGMESELKISTAKRYESLYKNQIQKSFGSRRINAITRVNVRDWVKNLSEKGVNKKTQGKLSPKTIKNALSFLSTLYRYAIYDLELVDKNPCDHVRVPKATKKYKVQKDFYKEDEVKELIALLSDELDTKNGTTHATIILLILFTGIRAGEAMGLKWTDIDFENNTLKIERERLSVVDVGVVEDTPKTADSIRTVSFPQFISDILRRLKSLQKEQKALLGEDYHDSGYVAVNVNGKPHHPNNTYRWFKRFLERNNLKPATIHDLRHTHTAMLSSLGVEIFDVSRRLGHSNTRITQEVYEYLFKDADHSVSQKLDGFYEQLK